jgi:hypothetical protein
MSSFAELMTEPQVAVEYFVQPYRHYLVNGQPVPSVTQILGCLDKPALPWWGMKVGVDGVLKLIAEHDWQPTIGVDCDDVVKLLTANKLTVNHVRDKAADRGTAIHDALEQWGHTGQLPDPSMYSENEQGHVAGLVAFLTDAEPSPLGMEVIVGSAEHQFAGRYDLRVQLPKAREVCVGITKAGKESRATIPAGLYLADLKTSSGIYNEALLQLAGYEGASIECGLPATDHRAVIRTTANGKYEVRLSHASYDDFLCVRRCYGALQRLKEAA